MNNDDLLIRLLEQKRHIEKIHRINDDLSNHLIGSIIQLLRYGEKYNVVIPRKEQLEQILLNSKFLLEEYNQAIDIFDLANRQLTRRTDTDKLPEPEFLELLPNL